ncbi:hypothetical protein N658DRAFT_562172 [Parathielavia hyrcaniae]|uniref:Uncharacterized protein n=1 Tax=Parathielavia hyrcaniae TaxID=113614 RepID=A0AAN6PWK7_9PEZI|nr:hypothetical protein N658DRAFT_562172 [Parathielavia hyrcaniae]
MASNTQAQLPDGYETRRLEPQHLEWVTAMIGHTLSFDSLWAMEVPGARTSEEAEQIKTKRVYELAESNIPSAMHCIASGLSYGVFIKGWTPRRKDTKPGGQLHWDTNDTSASREELLEQMDFALVAVALTQDAAKPKTPPPEGHKRMDQILPLLLAIRDGIARNELEGSKGIAWKPPQGKAGKGKVAKRSGTCTRGDFAGRGLSKALLHHVMRALAEAGYQGIDMQASHRAVEKVCLSPPLPFRAYVLSRCSTRFDLGFETADVNCVRIWIVLREKTDGEKMLLVAGAVKDRYQDHDKDLDWDED